jgi:hypothetical protein
MTTGTEPPDHLDDDDPSGEDAYSERYSGIDPSSELIICLDPDTDDYLIYDGPKDSPIWSLFVEDEDGDYVIFEEKFYCCLGSDLTYQGAIDLAETLGLYGRIIGFRGSDELPAVSRPQDSHRLPNARTRGHRIGHAGMLEV